MKMSSFVKTAIAAGLILLSACPQTGHAQKRYAAFIHGFTFGDDRDIPLSEKGSRWEASGTPSQWSRSAGAIDDYILLRYYDRDLYGDSRDRTLDPTREEMMRRFVEKMRSNAPSSAQWVLVGHSQGGIVARLLHQHIRRHAQDVNVEGVLAIASPMQGATASEVSYGRRSGHINIKATVDGLINDLLVGPLNIGPLDFTVSSFIANHFAEPRLRKQVNSMAVNKNAQEAIGPGGDLIDRINRGDDPDAYRALLGAERSPTSFRVLSGATTSKEPTSLVGKRWEPFLISDLDKGFSGIFDNPLEGGLPEASAGEEPKTVSVYGRLLRMYRESVDASDNADLCFNIIIADGCFFVHNTKMKWKQGKRALENIERIHAKVTNAYRTERRIVNREVCYNHCSGQSRTKKAPSFSPPSLQEYVSASRSCSGCVQVPEVYYATVPDKTDGLLGTTTTTWDPPRRDFDAPNLGPHSILYNDRPTSDQYKKGGTGYNHAELVYSQRRYSSSNDPGVGGLSGDESFRKGDPNPPMQEGRRFLERQVFR